MVVCRLKGNCQTLEENSGLKLKKIREVPMAKCPYCEKTITLKKGEQNQIRRQTEGVVKKEVLYSCPHCETVLGFGFFLGGLVTGQP